jgi:hypothetical protein
MDDSNENNDKNIDIEELVKVQSRVRGFLGRAKCRKNKQMNNKQDTYQYTPYANYGPRGPPGPPFMGMPPRGPPGPPGPPFMGMPPRGPPAMNTSTKEENTIVDDEKKTEEEDVECDENSNKDKVKGKKKSISMNNIISLAKLVQKEVVNEDEFRDIVKRIRKRNEEIEWSLKQELILKSIGEKSCCYFLLHRDISEAYRKMYQKSMMGIFTQTMISSIIMFVAAGLQDSCNTDNKLFIIPIVAGALNLLIAFQQKILEFKQPERFMLEHATTSKSFREIYDDINIQLGLARKERSPMPIYLTTMREKYHMCKKIAPYVAKSSHRYFEAMYLNTDDPSSINGKNKGNFINAYQLKLNPDEIGNGFYNNEMKELLARKKQNGIPEDILGLTPIDISIRDLKLSDIKRRLDNEEEELDYKLRSEHNKHQLEKKYKEQEEDYNYDYFDMNSSNNSSADSDEEHNNHPVLLLRGGGKRDEKRGEENV